MNPKVYLIHATEDKERFVVNFAKALRAKGIDVWLDQWEMKVGDKLIEKMFDQGIKNASAFLIVLSKNSVTKKWVKEELDTAIVKRIEAGSKILPIIIEECEIPEALKTTLWIKILDINDSQKEVDDIIASILGQYDKPPLGDLPDYTKKDIVLSSEINKIDNIVLKMLCDKAMELDDFWIHPHTLEEELSKHSLNPDQFYESLDMLNRKHLIKTEQAMGGIIVALEVNPLGFDEYFAQYIENAYKLTREVASLIINKRIENNEQLIAETGQPKIVIEHILNLFKSNGYIEIEKAMGNYIFIFNISPELKRILSE